MPIVQEIYQRTVERSGPDSTFVNALRDQMAAEEYRQGMSAERLFIAGEGARPSHEEKLKMKRV